MNNTERHDELVDAGWRVNLDEAPWGAIKKGEPLDARGLANRLRQYQVTSGTVREGDKTAKGYKRVDLHDPWSRYVGAPPYGPVTSVTPSQPPADCDGVTDVTPSVEVNPDDDWHLHLVEPEPLNYEETTA